MLYYLAIIFFILADVKLAREEIARHKERKTQKKSWKRKKQYAEVNLDV